MNLSYGDLISMEIKRQRKLVLFGTEWKSGVEEERRGAGKLTCAGLLGWAIFYPVFTEPQKGRRELFI